MHAEGIECRVGLTHTLFRRFHKSVVAFCRSLYVHNRLPVYLRRKLTKTESCRGWHCYTQIPGKLSGGHCTSLLLIRPPKRQNAYWESTYIHNIYIYTISIHRRIYIYPRAKIYTHTCTRTYKHTYTHIRYFTL